MDGVRLCTQITGSAGSQTSCEGNSNFPGEATTFARVWKPPGLTRIKPARGEKCLRRDLSINLLYLFCVLHRHLAFPA